MPGCSAGRWGNRSRLESARGFRRSPLPRAGEGGPKARVRGSTHGLGRCRHRGADLRRRIRRAASHAAIIAPQLPRAGEGWPKARVRGSTHGLGRCRHRGADLRRRIRRAASDAAIIAPQLPRAGEGGPKARVRGSTHGLGRCRHRVPTYDGASVGRHPMPPSRKSLCWPPCLPDIRMIVAIRPSSKTATSSRWIKLLQRTLTNG